MPLNEWHAMFYEIYGLKNIERDRYRLFAHLVEVVAGFARHIRKDEDRKAAKEFLAKMLAWFCALSRELKIQDLERLLWDKFPLVCPYCKGKQCRCGSHRESIDVEWLERMSIAHDLDRPRNLNEWQRMFRYIYGRQGIPPQDIQSSIEHRVHHAFFRLLEELGELAEACRLEHVEAAGVRNEAADVLAWIFALANLLPEWFGLESINLAEVCWDVYPGRCKHCGFVQCKCPNDRVRGRLSAAGGFRPERLDDLTGAQLRRDFDRELPSALAAASDEQPLALCMADIDHFKSFNDVYGHQAGDLVLRRVCDTIIGIVAARGGRIYRYGGEEIALVFTDTTLAEAAAIAERVRKAVEKLRIEWLSPEAEVGAVPQELRVTLSCGVSAAATSELEGDDAARILRRADEALYRAKSEGRNRIFTQD
ncbi:GGDEF domain-containing protein [Longimicrobium sp.]|uniref:GGDEF domain-containing protein n=1 Tax=Longimicrobium sp. TaxID=2029185 RepID=UPI003B3BDBB3